MTTKYKIKHWGQNYNVKVFRSQKHLSGHAQTVPPSYRNLQEKSQRLQGYRAHKEQLKKLDLLGYTTYHDNFAFFEFRRK